MDLLPNQKRDAKRQGVTSLVMFQNKSQSERLEDNFEKDLEENPEAMEKAEEKLIQDKFAFIAEINENKQALTSKQKYIQDLESKIQAVSP